MAQPFGALRGAHEGAHTVAALGEMFDEPTPDLSGRSGDEDFHVRSMSIGARGRLEETAKHARMLAGPPRTASDRHMLAVCHDPIAPSASSASALAALFVDECNVDMPRVSIPRAEPHLVARFGPSTRSGLDLHAIGVREQAHRKLIRGGQRIVMARLRLGMHEAVLGVHASEIAGRIVPLEDLWGDAATRRLTDRLACARDMVEAARLLERAVAERLATRDARPEHARLVLDAAERLGTANVNTVAGDLGVSDRNLRRVFREAVGMGPKAFAKLARFHRALRAASENNHASWADIAVATGYYDQAHLIAEFREIAGATPRALLRELQGASGQRDGGAPARSSSRVTTPLS
ncbi:transcriptional regulator, Fis family protein [Minicystis rosea]|nr:transcriptional regulator, Fis family protein [Minicystis rosea]